MVKQYIVIGAGFSGIAAATTLAEAGEQVLVLEKNSQPGGRASVYKEAGFTFDMGPSWYWMPEVFERYFNRFGASLKDYYLLTRLNPSYRIFFEDGEIDVPAQKEELLRLVERLEPGAGKKLEKFLSDAAIKYEVAMREFIHKPSRSPLEYTNLSMLRSALNMRLFSSVASEVRNVFKNEKIIQMLEFPVLFLGATPEKTPALYTMMNHADLTLGTWYPKGGFGAVIKGMVRLAEEKGVQFLYNQEVEQLEVSGGEISSVITKDRKFEAASVIASADYHHVEQHLLPVSFRSYSSKYWDKRILAPSALLFFIGVNKKLPNLLHHNLFFDASFTDHAHQIYEQPEWPHNPLFYVCNPSKTDAAVAPDECENLFILMPAAPGIEDSDTIRKKYFNLIMDRLEERVGEPVRDHIIVKKSFAQNDFTSTYNAFKGNAYGLANTLFQTAFLKPSIQSKKVINLYYCGQLTVPGPGVPPALISGQIAADYLLSKDSKPKKALQL